jgi:hypothetical protein
VLHPSFELRTRFERVISGAITWCCCLTVSTLVEVATSHAPEPLHRVRLVVQSIARMKRVDLPFGCQRHMFGAAHTHTSLVTVGGMSENDNANHVKIYTLQRKHRKVT